MKKSIYKQPTTQVVIMQQQTRILNASEKGSAGVRNYEIEDEQNW